MKIIEQFFALAKERGITASQVQIAKSKSTSFSLFRKEIDSFSVEGSQSIRAAGIYNGKFGVATTQRLDKTTPEYLVNSIIESASLNESPDEREIFKGSEKYHKRNLYDPALQETTIEEKIALAHKIEEELLAYDPKVTEVEAIGYAETEAESEFHNSYGLKLKNKRNLFHFYAGAIAKDGEETKSAFDVVFGTNLKDFDEKPLVQRIGDRLLAKFGGVQCEAGKYPTVLRHDVFSSLLGYFLDAASSDEIQRQSSFLCGKLNEKIASTKLSISERPYAKNLFYSYFDAEGVARSNKDIVKNGVLKTYFYNLETAKKDGVETTGNAQWAGNKMGIGWTNVFVKGSKKSFDDMIAPIKEGVFITEIEGLGTGMNEVSGQFSCQAQGFMIRDGKIAEPLTLITLSGTILGMLQDIKDLSSEAVMHLNSITCPDVLIKRMSIGGK